MLIIVLEREESLFHFVFIEYSPIISNMPISLSETSAFVLICDQGVSYRDIKSYEFLSHLDLSKGQTLYDKLKIFLPYIKLAINNRKWLIHDYIERALKSNTMPIQVLILACGWDPIMFKMSEKFPKHFFFGVDKESVTLQSQLVKAISPQSNISYLQVDITNSDDLLYCLSNTEWNKQRPTYVVAEGITYYINKEILWNTLKSLKENINSDFYVCGDFLTDWTKEKLSDKGQRIGYTIFETIKDFCALTDYYSYTREEIVHRLQTIGFTNISLFKQDEIQEKRIGTSEPWEKTDSYLQLFTA